MKGISVSQRTVLALAILAIIATLLAFAPSAASAESFEERLNRPIRLNPELYYRLHRDVRHIGPDYEKYLDSQEHGELRDTLQDSLERAIEHRAEDYLVLRLDQATMGTPVRLKVEHWLEKLQGWLEFKFYREREVGEISGHLTLEADVHVIDGDEEEKKYDGHGLKVDTGVRFDDFPLETPEVFVNLSLPEDRWEYVRNGYPGPRYEWDLVWDPIGNDVELEFDYGRGLFEAEIGYDYQKETFEAEAELPLYRFLNWKRAELIGFANAEYNPKKDDLRAELAFQIRF